MWSNMAGSGAWSVAMNMIEYAAPLGCFGCLQESSCPKTIWYLLPRRSDCTIAMRITWMLQYGMQYDTYDDTVSAFKFWPWFLSCKGWCAPLRRILRRPSDLWFVTMAWRRKWLRRIQKLLGLLGDLKFDAIQAWMTGSQSYIPLLIWYNWSWNTIRFQEIQRCW